MATCSVIDASSPDISEKVQKEGKEITVNFGVFFDGTNNQRLQVAMGKLNREKNSKKEKEKIKKDIERIGGKFDEEQFKKNGNIKYTLSNLPSDKEKEIEKLNKKIIKYNKKHGNLLDANEHETIESFAWDDASGVKDKKKEEIKKSIENLGGKFDEKEFKKKGNIKYTFENEPSSDQKAEIEELNKKIAEYNKDHPDTIKAALEDRMGTRVGMPRSPMQDVDFTNIARLEPSYKEQPSSDYTYKIYVTGSGTFADLDKGIDITGLAAGQNSAGVVQKVKDALDAIAKIIVKINSPDNKIERVNYKFNVFGFSRGATEARLFIDLCSKVRDGKRPELLDDIISAYNHKFNKEKEKKSSLSAISFGKQISIEFPFVGLFDTVSSVGINPGIWNNVVISGSLKVAEEVTPSVSDYHKNNKNDLGLDTLVYDSNVKHIVHICALDEFRENFALQVLPTGPSKVEQFFLPGVHADIGGGDLDGYGDEKHIPTVHRGKTLYIPKTVTPGVSQKKQDLFEINLNNLKTLGWIKDSNDSSLMPDITGEENGVIKLQKYTERGYTYLPLNIMAEKACEKSCNFDNLKGKYAIPSDLPQDFSAIQTDWKGNDSKFGHCYFPEDNVYKLLRQRRLHFSSCIMKTAGLAYVNGPNLTESDDGKDPVPYYDRFLDYETKAWYGIIDAKTQVLDIKSVAWESENADHKGKTRLGEAVAVFESTYTTNKDDKGNLTYNYNDYIKINNAIIKCNAKVTIYGINGDVIVKTGATMPYSSSIGVSYNKKLNAKQNNILKEGSYHAVRYSMNTSAYRFNKTYLILTDENHKKFLNKEKFSFELPGKLEREGRGFKMEDIFIHRTNKHKYDKKIDVDESSASSGCLVISGNEWEDVESQLGESEDIFIYLKRSKTTTPPTSQASST